MNSYGLPRWLAKAVNQQTYSLQGLKATLRPYQTYGVKYILRQQRVLLGDEMGLGKTAQAIATMVALRNAGKKHFMVICPASVLENWVREAKKFSDLNVFQVHGKDKMLGFGAWYEDGGVAVTTFETVIGIGLADWFKVAEIIVDEAHYIKNPKARRTMAVANILRNAERILFMTGTPIENKPEEMIQLVSMLQPQTARMLEKHIAYSAQFREIASAVYYRRRREQVLKELPTKTDIIAWCPMGDSEKIAYARTIFGGSFMEARRVSWNVGNLANSTKARALSEIVSNAEAQGRKVIVFSFFRSTLDSVKAMFGSRATEIINGSITPAKRQQIIDDFSEDKSKVVLVSQIQAGGTGLNIQSASVVVFCEPQYKPSIEAQAVARAYRMGQNRNVLVYRLISPKTVDERITAILQAKQDLFNRYADKSKQADKDLVAISEENIRAIMKAEREALRTSA